MLKFRLAAKISPPILAVWAVLESLAISGCGAPELLFADEMVDAAAPPEQPDAGGPTALPDSAPPLRDSPGVMPDARTGEPSYLISDGRITASDPGTFPEDMTRAWDNDPNTKWFVPRGGGFGGPWTMDSDPWTAFEFANNATHVLTSYTITSANDYPERDPKSWTLDASDDGQTWITLDTQTNQNFSARFQKLSFPVVSSTAYHRYRFYETNNNGWEFQVADIGLYGY